MYKRVLSFLIAGILFFQTEAEVFASEPPKETELYAKSAVLMGIPAESYMRKTELPLWQMPVQPKF